MLVSCAIVVGVVVVVRLLMVCVFCAFGVFYCVVSLLVPNVIVRDVEMLMVGWINK